MVASRLISTRARVLAPLAAFALPSAGARAQESTPAAGSLDTLESLLRYVPLAVLGEETPPILATFADIVAQLAVTGAERPDSVEGDDDALDAWQKSLSPLAIPSELQFGAYTFLTRAMIGFDMTDVDAVLDAGESPAKLLVLRGRFDTDRLRETWLTAGYRETVLGGATVYSLHAEGEIDVSSEVGKVVLARLNNAALLPDGTLLYAPTLALLERAVAAAQGGEPSIAERVDVRALLDAQTDALVSGVLFFGIALAGQLTGVPAFQPNAQGTPSLTITSVEVEQQMPPIALGMVGITAGGALPLSLTGEETPDPSIPDARVIYSLLMVQPGSAERAGEIAEARLATLDSLVLRMPYRELFASWETEVLADGQVLRLEIINPAGAQAGGWHRYLFSRDVLFLA
jgi:hypothetical protein